MPRKLRGIFSYNLLNILLNITYETLSVPQMQYLP